MTSQSSAYSRPKTGRRSDSVVRRRIGPRSHRKPTQPQPAPPSAVALHTLHVRQLPVWPWRTESRESGGPRLSDWVAVLWSTSSSTTILSSSLMLWKSIRWSSAWPMKYFQRTTEGNVSISNQDDLGVSTTARPPLRSDLYGRVPTVLGYNRHGRRPLAPEDLAILRARSGSAHSWKGQSFSIYTVTATITRMSAQYRLPLFRRHMSFVCPPEATWSWSHP